MVLTQDKEMSHTLSNSNSNSVYNELYLKDTLESVTDSMYYDYLTEAQYNLLIGYNLCNIETWKTSRVVNKAHYSHISKSEERKVAIFLYIEDLKRRAPFTKLSIHDLEYMPMALIESLK